MNDQHLEIIKTARNMSVATIEILEESQSRSNSRASTNFFRSLAENEKTLLELLEEAAGKGVEKLSALLDGSPLPSDEIDVFSDHDIAEIASSAGERDALHLALEREQKNREFLRGLARKTKPGAGLEVLRWLIKVKGQSCKKISYAVALVGMQMLDVSEQTGIPYVPFDQLEIDPAVTGILPDHLARRFTVFPISLNNKVLRLATSNPTDFAALDSLENELGYSIQPVIVNHDEIVQAIDREYGKLVGLEKNIEKLLQEEQAREQAEETAQEEAEEKDVLEEGAAEAPIVSFVNLLIHQAIEKNASDLHIEPQERGVDVRIRIDGILHKLTPPTKSMLPAINGRIKILAGMDISQTRLPQDGHFRVRQKNIDIRVSTMPTVEGEKTVLRLLDKSKLVQGVTELGFEPEQMQVFQNALNRPQGVILVTGPTGSGKTTTLYSGLNYLLGVERNIVTVEDPVEYKIPYKSAGISQVQVRNSAGLTFATALRSILRQDPDIIMVGEIRDLETANMAVRASLTGHLVLSTLHTNNAIATITRLQDMGVKTYMLGPCLNLIVAQRLVRRICERCKEVCQADPALVGKLEISPQTTLFRGSGCRACMHTGYLGRVAIYEMLAVTRKVARAITNGASEEELAALAAEQGMISLRQSGVRKIEQGITTIEEVMARTMEED